MGLQFTQVWVDLLTGMVNGLAECEVTEEVQYTGDRLVVKASRMGFPSCSDVAPLPAGAR